MYLLVLLFAASIAVKGQQGDVYPTAEKVSLFADRTLYIVGEEVHFSSFILSDDKKMNKLSLILYAEIVSPDGISVAGNKFPIVNYTASGSLAIPKDILTGIYYLRAYTKYMRNVGPDAYCYVAMKIINPQRSDVMSNNNTKGFVKNDANTENTADAFVISTDKNEYAQRGVINVSVKATTSAEYERLCISVVPEASSPQNILQLPTADHTVTSLHFYPETRGISITGELKDNANGKVVPDVRVNLSIIGKGHDFMAMQTDSSGRYFFSLPTYTGLRDLFLSTVNSADYHPKILVDNDFCALPLHLPSPIFQLSSDERAVALSMAMNVHIGKLFNIDTIPCATVDERDRKPFYGKPAEILTIDNYVQLPSLEEYFNELPTAVKVRKRQGVKYFKVLGTQSEMAIFDPLILLDWMAVDDQAKILAISPQNIARIEIVNQPYVKGDITYGGIISIISKRGDFAGIDLPASGIFINYRFLADSNMCNFSNPNSSNIPDSRNTLFWEPNLKLNAENNAHISFASADTPGRYAIVLKGITRAGDNFTCKKVFGVNQGNNVGQ